MHEKNDAYRLTRKSLGAGYGREESRWKAKRTETMNNGCTGLLETIKSKEPGGSNFVGKSARGLHGLNFLSASATGAVAVACHCVQMR